MSKNSQARTIEILTNKVEKFEQEKKDSELKALKAKNLDFVQLNRSSLRNIGELINKNKLSVELLFMFAQVMDKQNSIIMSFKTMETIVNRGRNSLSKAIKVLKDDKWIQVVKIGTSNAYVLNSSVFWTDKGSNRYRAEFTAKVLTNLDEQNKDLRKNKDMKLKKIPTLYGKEITSKNIDPSNKICCYDLTMDI